MKNETKINADGLMIKQQSLSNDYLYFLLSNNDLISCENINDYKDGIDMNRRVGNIEGTVCSSGKYITMRNGEKQEEISTIINGTECVTIKNITDYGEWQFVAENVMDICVEIGKTYILFLDGTKREL